VPEKNSTTSHRDGNASAGLPFAQFHSSGREKECRCRVLQPGVGKQPSIDHQVRATHYTPKHPQQRRLHGPEDHERKHHNQADVDICHQPFQRPGNNSRLPGLTWGWE